MICLSSSQGFLGALAQYWTVNEKPRLARKNTYFDDVQVSDAQALRVGIGVSMVATAIIVFWSILGVVL